MPDIPTADDVAAILQSMNKGQYLLFALAVRAAGGEVRIDPAELGKMAYEPAPPVEVDGDDGPVVITIKWEIRPHRNLSRQ